ncbi:cyclic nucleotide-binding-like protein [Gautieria morchelliformis]|nr:cyclic nucleotide-binding-like protein [Gautieria morchelliformis]
MSTFEQLIADLTRDVSRVQPKDALQYCSNWFQLRLEEQRARTRDALSIRGRSSHPEIPTDHIKDSLFPAAKPSPFNANYTPTAPPSLQHRTMQPFPGTLNVPGNALLPNPPLTYPDDNSGDFLQPPMSTLGRRVSVSAESGLIPDQELDEPTPVFPKSDEHLKRIKASISRDRNFLFRDLNEEQETGVLNAMQETRVPAGHVVIRQGDDGNYFYIVEEGLLYCYIRDDKESLPPVPEGVVAENFTPADYDARFGRKVTVCKENDSFGELALMYNHPRAASVVAVEASTLWQLDRITFRKIVTQIARRRRKMYEDFLKGVPLLSPLDDVERSKIADVLTSEQYADGEAVVNQGDPGDTFYFVEEGEAVTTKRQKTDSGEWEEVQFGTYKNGDYFGELALLRTAPRAATVRAVHRTDPSAPRLKCARLGAAAFTRLLGPLRELMERKAGESYAGYR